MSRGRSGRWASSRTLPPSRAETTGRASSAWKRIAGELHYTLDAARAAGMSRVQLWTARENTAARRLYEKIGMTLTSTRQVDEATEWTRYERDL